MLNDPSRLFPRDPESDHTRQDEMDGTLEFSASQAIRPLEARIPQLHQWHIENKLV
jgi:hypothetical protein